MKYSQLTSQYLLKVFPEFEKEINNQTSFLEEELPHCLYADVLNPFLRTYFKSPNPNDEILVKRIFNFFEDLASSGDFETKNLLAVSLLEPLWDYRESYYGSMKFMGDETKVIFDSLSNYLSIPKSFL